MIATHTYMLNLGDGLITLNGYSSVTLRAVPPRPFRVRRLVIRAVGTPLPWSVRRAVRWLAWVRLPWLVHQWDDERGRWGWQARVVQPTALLLRYADQKAQRRALERCYVRDIRVGTVGAIAGRQRIPASVFESSAPAPLELPTCGPQEAIEVVLVGEGGPLSIVAIGDMEALS